MEQESAPQGAPGEDAGEVIEETTEAAAEATRNVADTVLQYLPDPSHQQILGYIDGFWALLPQLVAALLFLLLWWLLTRLLRWVLPKLMRRANARTALIDVTKMIASVVMWSLGILIAVTIAFPSVSPGDAVTALGIGGIAVGLAFRDTFENFFAGILILIREPFKRGDFIECEGVEGQIEEITIRDSRIRQTDGELVVAPNGFLFKNPVTVRTAEELRRTTVICGVAYGEDVDKARDVIEEAVRGVDMVRDDVKDVQIFAREFGDSSVNFEVTWWTGSQPIDIRRSRDKVVAAVKHALDEAGIEIPFPYRTLTFKEPLPLGRPHADEGPG